MLKHAALCIVVVFSANHSALAAQWSLLGSCRFCGKPVYFKKEPGVQYALDRGAVIQCGNCGRCARYKRERDAANRKLQDAQNKLAAARERWLADRKNPKKLRDYHNASVAYGEAKGRYEVWSNLYRHACEPKRKKPAKPPKQ